MEQEPRFPEKRGQFNDQDDNPKPLFGLGQVVGTPGALRALEDAGQHPLGLLTRHVTGDWGDLCDEDRAENKKIRKIAWDKEIKKTAILNMLGGTSSGQFAPMSNGMVAMERPPPTFI